MDRYRRIKRITREVKKGKEVNHKLLGFNKVYFIHHALLRMKERGVTQTEVFATIESPDETGLPTEAPRKRVRKRRDARTSVDVVYEIKQNGPRIITVMVQDNTGSFRSQRLAQRKKKRGSK